jgi:hypothetical protein
LYYEKSTLSVEICVFLSGYIKTQKLQTENMHGRENVSLSQQHSQACKEKSPNYGSALAFGQAKCDEMLNSRLDMWQILDAAAAWGAAAGDEARGDLRSQAQAAGRFEQEGGIAGGQPARIGQ